MAPKEQDDTAGSETSAPPPAEAENSNTAKASGLFAQIGGLFKRFWQTILTAGVIIWTAIFLLLFWSSGLIDNLRPGTPGIIHIESPQIYTRERLVNDRFREQAWLEKQLAELEERAEVISSYRKNSIRLSASSAPAEETADPASVQNNETAGNGDNLEEKLLVSADDSFNLQRNVRATIRRALIENQLDDRHDLGSNSLYQFNFGAAIIAGSRTRRIAAIEMEIGPVNPLQPLDALVTGDSVCAGLREYECAYLFDEGILEEPSDAEREMLIQYGRWKQLFHKWLGAENAAHEREADDIRKLLSSPQASAGIYTQMKPFFNNINRLAKQYMESFDRVSASHGNFNEDKCHYDPDAQNGDSIEDEILSFIEDCVTETNRLLAQVQGDLTGVIAFLNQKLSYVPNTEYLPPGTTRGELVWGEYFRYVFNRFNAQCAWGDGLVEQIREPAPDPAAPGSQDEVVSGAASSPEGDPESVNPAGPVYRLTVEVENNLLACISRSVIRDYGSHPFGQVEREQGTATGPAGGEIGIRTDLSTYRAERGLSSIVVTSQSRRFRTRERTEYVGVAAQYSQNTTDNGLEAYTHSLERLNRTCSRHDLEIADNPDYTLLAGTSSDFDFSLIRDPVDPEIGWNLIAHLICSAYDEQPAAETDRFQVNAAYQLPIGLFRFIGLLSGNQRTFSYSVQPSGAFNLQRRDQSVDWSITNLFTGSGRGNQIAASGDTTESWIEKQYRIIGFGAQVDYRDDQSVDHVPGQRKAKFGWYVFPAVSRGGLFSLPAMESANIKLSALVSLPAWWENVDIRVTTSWRDIDSPGSTLPFTAGDDSTTRQTLRVELPTRLEFIRNHFPNTAAIRPSLYQLQLPKVALRVCEDADIVLKGERLWRSTVVTLGSQKSTLIQVMPDMRGIIAHFENVLPFSIEPEPDDDLSTVDTVPVTVWTSEGQKSVIDTVSLIVPEAVESRINLGLQPCENNTRRGAMNRAEDG